VKFDKENGKGAEFFDNTYYRCFNWREIWRPMSNDRISQESRHPTSNDWFSQDSSRPTSSDL